MKKLIIVLLTTLISCIAPKKCCAQEKWDYEKWFKKTTKFSTLYAAVNGGTSLSNVDVFSVDNGLSTETIETPYDYNLTLGVRKIARFGYENKAKAFYDGTETNYSDAATVGKVKGLEYLFEIDVKRQEGVDYLDQHHFIRYSSDDDCDGPFCVNHFSLKIEYLQDGFADVEYFEASQRYRFKYSRELAFGIGLTQRLADPYGYDPLAKWMLDNGNIHYTYLALQEGYNVDVHNSVYTSPSGEVVATSPEVWEAVVIPQVISDYVEKEKDALDRIMQQSIVIGFDYYKYTKTRWLHAWGSIMPFHYNDGSKFSYHNFIDGNQWNDYAGGIIFGQKISKHLGVFVEGKYNKYWNREWYDFKCGVNYVIF
jgi:hypothetical protein